MANLKYYLEDLFAADEVFVSSVSAKCLVADKIDGKDVGGKAPELVEKIHLDSIVIREEYLMELKGENSIYILFNRDWGGEDLDDNGVAVLIEDGEVTEVGYKDIAF